MNSIKEFGENLIRIGCIIFLLFAVITAIGIGYAVSKIKKVSYEGRGDGN